MNQEIDYERLTWTPTRTISASAINSWIGEELRTKGLELSLTHRGRASGSPHDFGVDGGGIQWQRSGRHLAGVARLGHWRPHHRRQRTIELADLPVYRPDGPINKQTRDINLFREIDGRAGYYAVGAATPTPTSWK